LLHLFATNDTSMGILNRLFGKHDSPPEKRQITGNLAFVLLSEPHLPDAQVIADAFPDFSAPEENLQVQAEDSDKSTRTEIISLNFNTGENCFVLLAPIPVPKGEADHHARFSLSSFRNNWKLPPHCAHLVVTLQSAPESSPIVQLSRFTSLLAAVIRSSPAVGVYWGNAGATHDSEFFVSVASEKRVVPRMVLWSGVSIASQSDGRLSLLSLGMKQLNLPDLLLIADKSRANDALATMFDLLSYVAQRGEALPEGDTVGRSDNDRLPVHYVRSPIDSAKKVWRVELP
jgi:Domain of unknown function (DUF4261)